MFNKRIFMNLVALLKKRTLYVKKKVDSSIIYYRIKYKKFILVKKKIYFLQFKKVLP